MADSPHSTEAGDGVEADGGREPATSTPRWMRVIGIGVIALMVLVVILLLTGGGLAGHGPGMHTP